MLKKTLAQLAGRADIHINGARPWDVTVHDPRTFRRIALHGSLGLGESYMDGWWDSKSLDGFFARLLVNKLDDSRFNFIGRALLYLASHIFNLQSVRRAFTVGEKHYDVGNDLYKAMLDSRLTYTCGYWKDAKNLEEAQEHKLRLVCEKLKLAPGMRVLDIGCGWGSFAIFAAKEYGVSVVGVTVSKEQIALAQERVGDLPVELRLLDYRDMPKEYGKTFDRVVSIGMFEHVGPKNYKDYFSVVDRVLKNDGLFLLHSIGADKRRGGADPWINKYIFPNGIVPTLRQVVRAAQGRFIMEDWHNFGTDYDKTLMSWYHNVENAWDTLSEHYDERFRRMWRYYLLVSAGSFRARRLQLWQVVFSRGVKDGYRSVR
ncbi:MAG: cyclopropane-fatty-acyl-phospholipid synthase [Parcubacteria group bacterium 21-54-25]|nr:MAG: cyclopropane-fatty-acyl-phospholipid synthase [Parcubacteria group bacterium 21-54-25]HQU08001.1 cyclopropane fatty acyl phospholipid synthase [Candidatus Paceibacterota bacterium]